MFRERPWKGYLVSSHELPTLQRRPRACRDARKVQSAQIGWTLEHSQVP
jgi:hypothetical protein